MTNAYSADKGKDTPLEFEDLVGENESRVWYAKVLLVFAVDRPQLDRQIPSHFAWVQWYENFGVDRGNPRGVCKGRRHIDPDRPEVLNKYYPRLFLPGIGSTNRGASWDLVPVQDIICPAPISPDVSIIHIDAETEARARQLQGPDRRKFLLEFPPFWEPYLPTAHQCKKACW